MLLLAALSLVAAACDDSSGASGERDTGTMSDAGGDSSTTTDTGTSDDTQDDTSAPGDTQSDATAAPDATQADTGGDTRADTGADADVEVCTGTLCGRPAMCCPEGNECVEGACLPLCPGGVRCGASQDVCCGDGELCLADACVAPRTECSDSYDCVQPGEFCEPTLGRCLPQPDPLTCTLTPTFTQLTATLERSWTGEEVISPPVVADLDGDGFPEVVVNATNQGGGSWPAGIIVVLDGRTLTERWRMPHDPTQGSFGSHGRTSIALGDVSGDGLPDIIFAGRDAGSGRSPIHAVDGFGNVLWTAHDGAGNRVLISVENGAPTLANFDADPMTEIVIGASLIDHDGRVVWRQPWGTSSNAADYAGRYGSNGTYYGGMSAVADIDGDGKPEIVSGRHAWDVAWYEPTAPGEPPTVQVDPLWTAPFTVDGYPAIADLDGNGTPEVVLVSTGWVMALDGATGRYWCGVDPTGVICENDDSARTQPVAIPGGGNGGPPTIADFDADGRPEIGVAGGSSYSVYDLARAGEDIVTSGGEPAPGSIYVRWSRTTKDQSSNVTGSSVFDFQGDGAAEVVYADECFMRVYSGADGTVQLEIENNSATIHEYPIVVDADADGNSEILIVANNDGNCRGAYPNHQGPTRGVYMFGDANDEWVPTRRVWTQHTYHVTNATSAGNVPLVEADSWTAPGVNSYRQNVQGEGVFNAPDLELSLAVGLQFCPGGEFELRARVRNAGALGVPAGIEVRFYEGTDANGTFIDSAFTTEPLLPGGSTQVSVRFPDDMQPHDFFAVVDGVDAASGVVNECDESNNSAVTTSARCLIN